MTSHGKLDPAYDCDALLAKYGYRDRQLAKQRDALEHLCRMAVDAYELSDGAPLEVTQAQIDAVDQYVLDGQYIRYDTTSTANQWYIIRPHRIFPEEYKRCGPLHLVVVVEE